MSKDKPVDKPFLIIVCVLLAVGLVIFLSASLGLLARNGASFFSIARNQFIAVFIGLILAFIISKINYSFWKKWAFHIFVASVVLTLFVFVPHIGLEYGGGKRWIMLGPVTLQPGEFLKLAFVMYCASWLSGVKDKITTFKYGLLPTIVLLGIVGGILLKQPDTDTFISIFLAAVGMFIVAGGQLRHLFVLGGASLAGFAGLVMARPYLMKRISTFLDPTADPLGAGYQIQQSLIAIGSGKFFGRGFGQSIQKFSYLPEPIGDSIFAVAAEEFGFLGSSALILLFLFLTLRSLKIASHAQDSFGGLLVVGIVILIVSGSFMNIASMLGVIPLSGLPLLFVSHGGTAMIITMIEVGIILNISRYQKQ